MPSITEGFVPTCAIGMLNFWRFFSENEIKSQMSFPLIKKIKKPNMRDKKSRRFIAYTPVWKCEYFVHLQRTEAEMCDCLQKMQVSSHPPHIIVRMEKDESGSI